MIESARDGQPTMALWIASSGSPCWSITTATASSSWSKVCGAYQLHCADPMHRSLSTRISRRDADSMPSVFRGEFEVQAGQPAEHIGSQVLVAAVASGAVHRFRDPDVRRAVEEPLDRDTRLRTGERGSRTGVDAMPERQVAADVLPLDAELGRALELARVPAGGTVDHQDRGAGRDGHAAELGRLQGQPELGLDPALGPQRLLDEPRDPAAVGPQPGLGLRLVGHPAE